MRVLVLCEYASLNGGERSMLEAVHRISAPDVQLIVAAPARGPLAAALAAYNLPHYPLDLCDDHGIRHQRPRMLRLISECLARTQPSVVHANSVSMSRLSGPVVAALKIPSLGHLRDMMRLSRSALDDLACHRRLLAVSWATRQWYVEAGLAAGRIAVVYNGVDLQRFQPRPTHTLPAPPSESLGHCACGGKHRADWSPQGRRLVRGGGGRSGGPEA